MIVTSQATVLRTHILVVLMPFIALAAWAVLGEAYQSVAIVSLMALFYLLPEPASSPPPGNAEPADDPA